MGSMTDVTYELMRDGRWLSVCATVRGAEVLDDDGNVVGKERDRSRSVGVAVENGDIEAAKAKAEDMLRKALA